MPTSEGGTQLPGAAVLGSTFCGLDVHTYGILNLVVSAFVLGRFPQYWPAWHLFKLVVWLVYMTVHRYRAREMFYYCELCWALNLLIAVYLGASLASPGVFGEWAPVATRLFFVFGTGTLGGSIKLVQNALTFHRPQELASCFIHAYPLITCWVFRWDPAGRANPNPFVGPGAPPLFVVHPTTWWECFSSSAVLYAAWLVVYTAWQLLHGVGIGWGGDATAADPAAHPPPSTVTLSDGRGEIAVPRAPIACLRAHRNTYTHAVLGHTLMCHSPYPYVPALLKFVALHAACNTVAMAMASAVYIYDEMRWPHTAYMCYIGWCALSAGTDGYRKSVQTYGEEQINYFARFRRGATESTPLIAKEE